MLLKDFEKSEGINHFSQESKALITDVGNNEIFEFYETASKRQCPDCAFFWAIGIVYCTCGKCMQPSAMNRQYNKDRFDSLSIPGYVMEKNRSRGPRHGPSMRQIMYHQARDMLRKAKLPKNGSCETILEHRCRLSKVVVCWKLDRRENQTVRPTCLGRPFLWSYTCRKETMAKEVNNCFKQRRSGRSDKTTTWFSWSEARLSSTTQWTCWKYWTRK